MADTMHYLKIIKWKSS